MRLLIGLSLIVSFVCCASPATGLAQSAGIAQKHHPWAKFEPGAWKLVRVVTETLDENGVVAGISITETKTTLLAVEDDGVTLAVEVCLEVAGKRFNAEPQTVKQGLHGELAYGSMKYEGQKTGEVTIEGKKFPCQILTSECSSPTGRMETHVYYSPSIAPYMLRRETVTTNNEGEVLGETTVTVMALDMPCKVSAEIKNAAYVRTIRKHSKGSVITWSRTSPDVPGGVVRHSSKEVDKDGHVIRRSTLELVDYGVESALGRPGVIPRLRPSRFHKPPPPPRRVPR